MKTPEARSGASIVRCRPIDDTVVQVGRDHAIVDLRLGIVVVAYAGEAGARLLEHLSGALLARLEMKDPRIAVRGRTNLLMPHRCAPLLVGRADDTSTGAASSPSDEGAC